MVKINTKELVPAMSFTLFAREYRASTTKTKPRIEIVRRTKSANIFTTQPFPVLVLLEMSLTILNCGRNCSGFSAALSLSSSIHENEGVILLNAGDSTQKFCNEYKIKLRQVSSVFLTSLAPHNISGLPALLLSLSDLGNKNLDIIGQIGTSSLLESMKVFTNRRYGDYTMFDFMIFVSFPELNIREISSTENILIDFAQFEIYPILATGVSRFAYSVGLR
jgi:hypothetical protein